MEKVIAMIKSRQKMIYENLHSCDIDDDDEMTLDRLKIVYERLQRRYVEDIQVLLDVIGGDNSECNVDDAGERK